MLSRRLIRKLEALTDEAQQYLERQADLLLTMPSHRRASIQHLQLVASAGLRMARATRPASSAVRKVQP